MPMRLVRRSVWKSKTFRTNSWGGENRDKARHWLSVLCKQVRHHRSSFRHVTFDFICPKNTNKMFVYYYFFQTFPPPYTVVHIIKAL